MYETLYSIYFGTTMNYSNKKILHFVAMFIECHGDLNHVVIILFKFF
jgi:hypothetical protein